MRSGSNSYNLGFLLHLLGAIVAAGGAGAACNQASAPPPAMPMAASEPPPAAAPSLSAAERFMSTIMHGARRDCYQLLHPKVRAIVTEASFVASLEMLDSTFGKVLDAQGKEVFIGSQKSTELGTIQIRKFTYAVTTTNHPKGTHFASVTVMGQGDDVAVQSYRVFAFVGNIPPNLR